MDINSSTVGIIVPTLGKRQDFLATCLDSIKKSTNTFTLVVCPSSVDLSHLLHLIDLQVPDPGDGLPAAINLGIESLPPEIQMVNWLGDDDFLEVGSIDIARSELLSDSRNVAVFGKCAYVDSNGKQLFVNNSGQWAVPLLSVGPDLIPQPGMLFKRSDFTQIGGVRTDLGWAFDFDLLLNLKKRGRLKYVNCLLANFRWHSDSLSVGQRVNSVKEASLVRVSHLPKLLRPIASIWEFIIRLITLHAGNQLSKRLSQR